MTLLLTLYRPAGHSVQIATLVLILMALLFCIAQVARGMRYLEFRRAVQRIAIGATVALLIPVVAVAEEFIMRDPCTTCRAWYPEWVCWLWMCF
jgi:VIT1/CCC1 family predicted Fe2+/Mn2+ transporter